MYEFLFQNQWVWGVGDSSLSEASSFMHGQFFPVNMIGLRAKVWIQKVTAPVRALSTLRRDS